MDKDSIFDESLLLHGFRPFRCVFIATALERELDAKTPAVWLEVRKWLEERDVVVPANLPEHEPEREAKR